MSTPHNNGRRRILMAARVLAAISACPAALRGATPAALTLMDVPPVWQVYYDLLGTTVPVGEIIFGAPLTTIPGTSTQIGQFMPFAQSSGAAINDAGLVAVALADPSNSVYPGGATNLTYLWQASSTPPSWNTSTATTNTAILVNALLPSNNPSTINQGDNLWGYNAVLGLQHSGDVLLASNSVRVASGYKPGDWAAYYYVHSPGTNSGQYQPADPGISIPVGLNTYHSVVPNATNTAGLTVGFAGGAISPLPSAAWIHSTTSDSLFPGPAGSGRSEFSALNERGVPVGYAEYQQNHYQAAVYRNNQLTLLGTLSGNTDSFANAINEPGAIVGVSGTDPSTGTGFLYKNGTMTPLGTLPGAADSIPYALNDAGTVVGESGGHAFLQANATMIDLNSLLPANSGWVLTSANSINNYGQIVGDGFYNGLQRGFLFELPTSGASTTLITQDSGTLDINGVSRLASGLTSAVAGGVITNSAALPVLLRLTNTVDRPFEGNITGNITLVKEGSAVQNLSGTNSYTGSTIVNAGKLSFSNTFSFPAASPIIINGGELGFGSGIFTSSALTMWAGKVFLAANAHAVLDLKTIPYLAAGATLDLFNNKLIVRSAGSADKAAAIATLNSLISTGSNGGTWTGAGITSSTAAGSNAAHYGVGLFDNAILQKTSFGGQPTDTNSVLITIAHLGDTNDDGVVNIQDVSIVANNWQQSRNNWAQGDLNRDGIVNIQDFSIVANNWQQNSIYSLTADGGSSMTSFAVASPAPEPASLGVLGALVPLVLRRRRGS